MFIEHLLCTGLGNCHGNRKHPHLTTVLPRPILGYGRWLLVIECFIFGAEETPLMIRSLVGELIAFETKINK